MAAPSGVGTPASTVFVGNLAYDLTEQDVVDYFGRVGPVKNVRIVTERETGKPRGFGFVEFHDIATADSAIRNLNGTEFNGRTIRIVFAEGPGDFRPRREDDSYRPEPRRTTVRSKLVGADLAYHSSHGMSTLLGQPVQPNAPADQLTVMLARKTRSELYEYLAQMQSLLLQNPQQARQVLIDNPQLTRALFHMEIILGMVNNPLGDIAPKGVAPPGILPPKHHDMPMVDQSSIPLYGQPANGVSPQMPSGPSTAAPPYGALPHVQYPPPEVPPPVVLAGQPALDPRLAAAPVDPRRQAIAAIGLQPAPMAPAPRPMISAAVAQPALQVPMQAAAAPSIPGMTPEQQQALLQQVMSLTPEQVELLPAQQKAQVLALQQQLRAQGR